MKRAVSVFDVVARICRGFLLGCCPNAGDVCATETNVGTVKNIINMAKKNRIFLIFIIIGFLRCLPLCVRQIFGVAATDLDNLPKKSS